jgi:hypothetical protein
MDINSNSVITCACVAEILDRAAVRMSRTTMPDEDRVAKVAQAMHGLVKKEVAQ